MRLGDRVCIVTGGASGIGRGIAARFRAEGARVVVADLDAAGAEVAARELGGLAVPTDVRDADAADRLVRTTLEACGRVDVLVNSAGIGRLGSALETTPEAWGEVLAVNLTGTFLVSRRAAQEMVAARRGKIINIASVAGLVGYAGRVAYCVSKAGVVMLTKAMALDCAPYGVQVNAICPGVVRTPMTEAALADPAALGEKIARIPLGRLGRPEDIAAAAVYLASPDADFVTGHALVVDGGMSVD
ncbi:MAG: SDR family oxidoreductase [Armatimonadota bacterium]|nr:SDR family oxidoreductase [Armatimonadota bacterium]MDR7421365.1 SDR family oxidoreductase [Armatimonadota bacterium]MDR7453315.1 SDR family oxidoreductase [Armatimonadota bacterium]MDR7456485.1 SDR family oxidoreductase [Armatimonadota bacterium]MDR7496248.1 SDR family oxidoreductase [Armatimonadota bacterium]